MNKETYERLSERFARAGEAIREAWEKFVEAINDAREAIKAFANTISLILLAKGGDDPDDALGVFVVFLFVCLVVCIACLIGLYLLWAHFGWGT